MAFTRVMIIRSVNACCGVKSRIFETFHDFSRLLNCEKHLVGKICWVFSCIYISYFR